MDFQNEIEDDYKHNEANVMTARSDWVWVMMTFQKDTSQSTGIMKTWFRFIIIVCDADLYILMLYVSQSVG